jgi:hypothetical protein
MKKNHENYDKKIDEKTKKNYIFKDLEYSTLEMKNISSK